MSVEVWFSLTGNWKLSPDIFRIRNDFNFDLAIPSGHVLYLFPKMSSLAACCTFRDMFCTSTLNSKSNNVPDEVQASLHYVYVIAAVELSGFQMRRCGACADLLFNGATSWCWQHGKVIPLTSFLFRALSVTVFVISAVTSTFFFTNILKVLLAICWMDVGLVKSSFFKAVQSQSGFVAVC
ncbi:hypothetical protein DAPPUDRAFT_111912 [Daphnia pulex]|uniref:Uncharacterized protein n=1 Tax=Daphnia pulex TaxID=6669 RepID=E9HAF9_DAPPU|nr:hypothetical protein DAPPUDRAFT_111912 [Daphnia pulex]|eukprot:EFX71300.1 hypothetical protein DAPPUDRAFT_111912 [Daphnia pulex]